jgi:hypothetical protein
MRRFLTPFVLGLTLASGSAHADWDMAVNGCARLLTDPNCGSCSALWPDIARCAAKAEGVDADPCIARVNDKYWQEPMAFDRVRAVRSCLKD